MSAVQLSRLHAVVSGHVQGVGFRAYVLDRAEFLGLAGWVRNTFEGDVEVMAEGPRADLETLLAGLEKGPRGAFVVDVRQEWDEPTGEFASFDVVRTV